MRFQDLVLSLSSLPTGSRFQDHINSISRLSSASYLSLDVENQITGSMEINNSANLILQDFQVSIGNAITININNELNDL